MLDYEARRNQEARLRKIVLNSADVLPGEVSEYLQEVAGRHANWDAKKQVLKEHKRLVDHLTKDYVDFVLSYLVAGPARTSGSGRSHSLYPTGYRDLGLKHDMEFYPPSHVQGPFLPVLRKDDEEGLRLVHTLVNTAVAKWREREQDGTHLGYSRRPLPVPLDLPNGRRDFWGNEQVYLWYRPNGNGPCAVISALMALEVWMEERMEAGADAEQLFEKVLSGSDCVAVLGLCLGIALAYPERCLWAALPIVKSPAVWTMEIPRFMSDRQGSVSVDPLGTHRTIYKLQDERDERPQRSLEVRHLAFQYVFSEDEALWESFEQAVGRFPENLPFRYQEEQEDPAAVAALRERMENFQVYGKRENYRAQQTDEGMKIWVEPPDHIRQRSAEAQTSASENMRWFSLDMWAQRTIEEGKAWESMTPEAAVAAAQEVQCPDDFLNPVQSSPDMEDVRVQAIAGVAAAVLVAEFQWAQEHDLISWCRDVLLAAASGPGREYEFDSAEMRYPSDIKVSAALGLGTLVSRGLSNPDVRRQVIRLAADPHEQVGEAVARGLRGAWTVDDVLCHNAFSLGLSLCLFPQEFRVEQSWGGLRGPQAADWAEELVSSHLAAVERGERLGMPRVPSQEENSVFLWHPAGRWLGQLPLAVLAEETSVKGQLLRLADDLMAWTVQQNTSEYDPYAYGSNNPYEWNSFFFRWAALLARSLTLDETRQHVLLPVKGCWPQAPRLTVALLYGYLTEHIADTNLLTEDSQAAWRDICDWVLGGQELEGREERWRLDRDVEEAISLIVFVRFGRSVIEAYWPHTSLFVEIIDGWVTIVGSHPSAYKSLLSMLDGPGRTFTPEPALSWLNRAVSGNSAPSRLWEEGANADRTAELLFTIWEDHETVIRRDTDSLRRYGGLVDNLVSAGVPLASLLQRRIEGRG